MSILDDIKRLGLKLEESEKEEIDKIVEHITKEKEDEFVRNALIEGAVSEFLGAFCPDVMDALIKDRERENEEWMRLTRRKFD